MRKFLTLTLISFFVIFSSGKSVFSATTDKDFALDDGASDSPQIQLTDQDDFSLILQKNDAGEAVILNNESTGVLRLIPSNDLDDYIYFSTDADLPGLFWSGVDVYTNAPSIRISATGSLEYRDQDELTYTPFDSLSAGVANLDDLFDVVISGGAHGDVIFYDGTNWVNLPAGTSGQVLQTQGAGVDPVWADAATQWTKSGSLLYPNVSDTDEIAVGGTTAVDADIFLGADGTAVINEQGNDADFRVEGDTQTHLIYTDASTDRVGIANSAPDTTLEINGTYSMTPSALASLGAGAQMTVTQSVMRIKSAAGAVTLGTPAIIAGADGQMVTILGTSDTDTVQFVNSAGLQLTRGVSFTMGSGDAMVLIYDGSLSAWVELNRSNN